MNATKAQTEAISHNLGPMLVLAGPGSGKTTVITNRVQHLVEHCGVNPETILVITFTKAAALEMKERFDLLTNHNYPAVTFGTFHACFFTILKYAYNYNASSIIKDSDAQHLLSSILYALNPALAEENDIVFSVRQEISAYKGNHAFLPNSSDPEGINYVPQSCDRKTFYAAYRRYDEELRRLGKVDFEDMLLLTYELLKERADILAFWQNRFAYLLIDEFQDINLLQYKIVKLLARPQNNLFIVGDDDQSIYAFRGSKPEIMLAFPNDYKDTKTVLLDVNYRSSEAILKASLRLIQSNEHRYPKKTHSNSPEGPAVRMQRFAGVDEENAALIADLKCLLASACVPSDIAVLYRTNLQPRRLTEALQRAEIPYRIHGVIPCLFDNVHLKPIFSYLRIATQKPCRNDVLLVSNKPNRYLPRQAFSSENVDFEAVKRLLFSQGKSYVVERIDKLLYDLKMLSRMNAYAAIHYIRNVIGYDAYLSETLQSPDEALSLADELLEDAKDYRTIADYLEHVTESRLQYKENARLREQTEEGIALMTFHGCKGLEFEHVYIIDCNETIIPHKKALLPEQIDEERRLLYVAMTRAKKHLTMYSLEKRFGRELAESRFLGEILLQPGDLLQGVCVRHKVFGDGTILQRKGDKVSIRFHKYPLPKTLSVAALIRERLITIC